MPACPKCSTQNPDDARFCMACGTPLGTPAPPPREVRKTVTVVFADVTGSTSLGERLDPESMRRVMARYFDEMRSVLERHGGTVEKFIGDAVMAVFGIPVLHEDDALRAVRSAWEMRDALAELNRTLEPERGVSISVRTGVNTGEVVAGDASAGQALVTGDAVNVAARLEQAAAPGEILVGAETHRLVRDAVRVDPLPPLTLKGKDVPVSAFRLLEVNPEAPGHERRLDSPMVGRDRELALLRWAFDRAVGERTCHLMTVLGAAGVGKSRLVQEFLATAGGPATVLRGRCLPYGEGITFWPVVEVVRQAAGITGDEPPEEALARLAAVTQGEEGGDLAGRRVAQVVGLAADSAVPEETFWAIRKMLEILARRHPLVVLFDDVHWAEPTFLDLVEHLAEWSRDAPMLLLCLGRQELLDARPGWGGGKLNATTILLESLTEGECERLIENLLGQAELAAEAQVRIAEAAEGNPLFVEEMLAMLIDDGLLQRDDGRWVPAGDLSTVAVPPTIQALLAARLDRLAYEERAVIERASVVGRVFYRGAVAALSPEDLRPAVGSHLMTLVRRELIRPQPSEFGGEDTFRFRHMLVRDAAYEAMPKETRADLHERFAGWLERAVGERLREFEEILGYHLEQAHRYLAELGPLDDHGRDLGRRAGRLLGSAGLRARARGDQTGSESLLSRAVALIPEDDPERLPLLPELAGALWGRGELTRAASLVSEAIEAAERSGDSVQGIRARLQGVLLAVATDPQRTFAEALSEAEALLAAADEIGEARLLIEALRTVGNMRFWAGDGLGSAEAGTRAIALARAAGLEVPPEVYDTLFSPAVWGPVPVDRGIPQWEEILEEHRGTLVECIANAALGSLRAMAGDFERAKAHTARARAIGEEMGLKLVLAAAQNDTLVLLLAGDPAAAVDALRPGIEILRSMGETGFLSTSAAMLGEALYRLGEDDEAERYSRMSEETAAVDDVASQAGWRGVRAKVLARRGAFEEAEGLAREAVAVTEPTDHLSQRGDSLLDLAEVLRLAGRTAEAVPVAEEAVGLFERKGNIVSAGRARALLEELTATR